MDYRLQDLIDIPLFQTLQDKLNEIYSFPSAIIDNEGNILTATAWQDICTKFHRVHPDSEKECRVSDQYILSHLGEAKPAVTYRCPHGLVDNATPIVIGGKHLGNYFTGQFFLEEPDLRFFRQQAKRYGFDEKAYLEAVARVPVWSQAKLTQYLDFIKGFVEILAGIGFKNLQEIEARRLIEEKEAALAETHLFNQQIIESAQDGIIVYGPDLRYRLWNPFMEKLSGVPASEVIGKHPLELFPFLKDAGVIERVERALRGEVPPTIDFPYRTSSGRSGWTSDTSAPLYGKDGRIVGVIAIVRDTTERKRAEEALRESEARFRRLVKQAPLALCFIDTQNAIAYFNDRFTQMFGYLPEDIPEIEEWWRLAYPDEDYGRWVVATWTAAVERAAKEKTDVEPIEYRVTCKDGTVRLIEISGLTLEGNVLATFLDVTERKRTEAALLTMQKLESLGTLAGGIAHDFNNVLTGVLGNLSLLGEKVEDRGEAADLIREAMDAAMTARGLARQLLTFSAGGKPVVEILDLAPLLKDAAGFAARGSNACCVFEIGAKPLPIRADKDQLAQVVQNLVLNAVQAMPNGGAITIRAFVEELAQGAMPPLPAGRYVRFSVEDEGVGISEAYLRRIFDPYFTTKAKGRGLGLAMCHSIIAKHGGHIGAESRPGVGSVFSIHLPALALSEIPRESDSAKPQAGTGHVLVMDDDDQVARVLTRMLESLGYRAETAAAGAQAIAAYRRAMESGEPFDVVIMDLTIAGGMGGRETIQKLLEIDPGARAVVSSGYSNDPVMSGWAEHGFTGVLAKPYRLEDVSRVIRQATDPKRRNRRPQD